MGVSCQEFKRDGAFAEWVVVPSLILERMPEGLGFEEAAFTEPLAVALHAVNLVKVKKGERALVVGSGLIGLLVIQALKRAGAGEVVAVDRDRKVPPLCAMASELQSTVMTRALIKIF